MSDAFRLYAVTGDEAHPARRLAVERGVSHPTDLVAGLPVGVYTALRSFDRERFLALDEHLERTERSMELSGWEVPRGHFDRDAIRRAMQAVIAEYPREAFLRLDVFPPGESVERPAWDAQASPVTGITTVLSVSPWKAPPADYVRDGVRVEFAAELTRATPLIKSADFALARRPYPLNTREAYEHLMLDERGRILEGTSANFYAFVDGKLRTAIEGVLAGITRKLVLELARELGFEVVTEPVARDEVAAAEEAFLTSSTRGIVPIVCVAGETIGDGKPGPRTRKLMDRLGGFIEERTERAWPPPAHAVR